MGREFENSPSLVIKNIVIVVISLLAHCSLSIYDLQVHILPTLSNSTTNLVS